MNVTNAEPSYEVLTFGEERESVVVIDRFSGELNRLITAGRRASYAPAQGYPGIRSPLDPNYLASKSAVLVDALSNVFGLTKRIGIESCAFSIVTTPPEKLHPSQRIPHYDGTEPGLIAVVQYTQGPETGGTSFYRHKRTGFETISDDRVQAYRDGLAKDDAEYGLPPNSYHHGTSDRYEMIGEVAAKPDRLILYRGCRLHSGYIPQAPAPDTAPDAQRLTVTAFLVGET